LLSIQAVERTHFIKKESTTTEKAFLIQNRFQNEQILIFDNFWKCCNICVALFENKNYDVVYKLFLAVDFKVQIVFWVNFIGVAFA